MLAAQLIALDRRQRRRYLRVARQLGLTKGRVLRQTFGEGLNTPRLTLITVRRGHWPEVLVSLTGQLARSGYQSSVPVPQGGAPPQRLYYRAPRSGQPHYRAPRSGQPPNLLLWVYAESEIIGRAGVTVPAGHTGLQFSLA